MQDFLTSWAALTWNMIHESALLLLFGFVLAGIIRALITPTVLKSFFGKSRFSQIFTASVVGVPLPLCSCSVLPVAAQLRRSGLSREGTVSFLISTPETGADSIALSYKLLGPVFVIARPIAALITAIFSGLMAAVFLPGDGVQQELQTLPETSKQSANFLSRLWEGQVYVWTDVFPELAYYLFWGYLLAGVAAALIPADLLQTGLSSWIQYLAVIAVSLPVYVCATSSTPLAAVLLSLGILPGAVLTFLLVGPATNLTSLVVQKRILGLKGTAIMTASVILCAVVCGVALDYFLGDKIASIHPVVTEIKEHGLVWYDFAGALLLSFFMAYYTGRHYYKKVKKKLIK
jgi:uncharacterized membrane protein YraQ (UPF0718 family)